MDDNTPVQDAEVIEENQPEQDTTPQVSDKGEVAADELFTIDNAIKSRLGQLAKLKNDLKVQREMLTSYLDNDPNFREATSLVKKASLQKNSIKAQLMKQPEANNLSETIKAMREQQQELQDGLSYYLREYQRITGANEFEGEDGELQQIVYIAKLVRKNPFKK